MKRRAFLRSALILGALVLGSGHTPYRQWKIYRKRYLLILTSKTDGPSYPLGKRVAQVLAAYLPASKARVTRAPHTKRIGSLISSKQMDVAVLSRADAIDFMNGRGGFDDMGPVELRTLFQIGAYLLISRSDFPDAHAYLVARTLHQHCDELPETKLCAQDQATAPVPWHDGVLAYFSGLPLPGDASTLGRAPTEDLEDLPHTHGRETTAQ